MATEQLLDLISRKALIAEYDRVHVGAPGGARKLMEDAPAVDAVEVVHGQWLPVYHNGKLVGGTCSVCGKFKRLSSMKMLREQYRFCHHCGARMDGDKHE
jgi:hypothetical protein